jgi:large subunit ribosomal protein L21
MYALVEVGGKQYQVEKGSKLLIDLMETQEGKKIKLQNVTLYRTDKDIVIGTPYIENAVVDCKVLSPEVKGEKLTVFKYKNKTNYKRKNGHRQKYTEVEVTGISLKDKAEAAKEVE